VTIEVKGRDQNSTYTNQFDENTKHYIPIYGLYPNTENTIELTIGTKTKTYTIETEPLPTDLIPTKVENNTNKLEFISSDTYLYAIDNNNEVRWYFNKKYSGDIKLLKNNRFLLNIQSFNTDKQLTELVEIDLLGKIYKQYNIETPYYTIYTETKNSIFVLSENLLEIDKQTGTILDEIKITDQYTAINYQEKENLLELTNDNQTLKINLETKEQTVTSLTPKAIEASNITLDLYNDNEHYKLTIGTKFNIDKKTEESSKYIFLINYKKIDKDYKKYNINFQKTSDNLQITGDFNNKNDIYLILDKFLDKRVYDIKGNHTIINKEGLSGKYSIYLKIEDVIYKTNTYVTF